MVQQQASIQTFDLTGIQRQTIQEDGQARGGADNANATINAGVTEVNGLAVPIISVGFMRNIATLEKLHYWFSTGQNAAGAANVPRRSNGANKWDNASVVVDQIATLTGGATNWTGGELLILGWDENQTHTPDENFWQLLASETLTGTDSNVQMTVAAKRYLWAQAYIKPTAALIPWLRFNNVSTGTPYANRQGDDGTETTTASQNQMAIGTSESTPQFVNMFILNVSALEKLVVAHSVSQQTAGEANTPSRRMMATKHALTGSQITEVDFVSSTSSFASGSVFKVWGAD